MIYAEQVPDQAGTQCVTLATTVAWNRSCREVNEIPWLCRTCRVYRFKL